jgi:hypothetical protein
MTDTDSFNSSASNSRSERADEFEDLSMGAFQDIPLVKNYVLRRDRDNDEDDNS